MSRGNKDAGRRRAKQVRIAKAQRCYLIARHLHRIAAAIEEQGDEALGSDWGTAISDGAPERDWDDAALQDVEAADGGWDDTSIMQEDVGEGGEYEVDWAAINPKDEGELLDLIDGDGSAISPEPDDPPSRLNEGNTFRDMRRDTFSSSRVASRHRRGRRRR